MPSLIERFTSPRSRSPRRTAIRAALGGIAVVAVIRVGCGIVAKHVADALDAESGERAPADIAVATAPRPRIRSTTARECGASYAAFEHRRLRASPGKARDIVKDAYARGLPAKHIEEGRAAVHANRAVLDDLRTALHCDAFDAPHTDPRARRPDFPMAPHMFRLGQALVLDADLRALEGDAQSAADEYVDVMRFGADFGIGSLAHLGGGISLLQVAIERIGSRALAPAAKVDLHALDAELAAIAPAIPSLADTIHRERTGHLALGAAAVRQRGIFASLCGAPYDPELLAIGSGWVPPSIHAVSLIAPIDLYVALQVREGDRNFERYENAVAVAPGAPRRAAIDAAIDRSTSGIGIGIGGWSIIARDEERLRESFAALREDVARAAAH